MDAQQAIGTRDASIQFLKALGYRVSMPRAKTVERPRLNAVGKPFGANYDPKYKIKTPKTSIKRLYGPMTNFPWVIESA